MNKAGQNIISLSKKLMFPLLGFGVWASGNNVQQYNKDQLVVHEVKYQAKNAKEYKDNNKHKASTPKSSKGQKK